MTYRRLRWILLGLLFLVTVLNYVDRQTLSVLGPTLRHELRLSESDYANVVTAFLLPYTVMYTLSGRLVDRVGVRLGLSVCLSWWSLATMLTATARNALQLAVWRFLLGIGEPGVFPAGIRAVAEWFPRRQRALAAGIFSSGSAVGAIVAPPLIAWLTLRLGWRYGFFIPGTAGFLLLPFWIWLYRPPQDHPAVTAADLAILKQDGEPDRPRPWLDLLKRRKVWALVLPRIASDPVWYFYLFWLPDYLQRGRGLSLTQVGAYGWVPFLFADLGNLGGGAVSDWLVRRGIPAARARLAVLAAVGVLGPMGALVGRVSTATAAIGLTCLVAFLTQAWATNMATLAADLFPRSETASVVGLMGTAGSLGGAMFSQVLGWLIASFGYPAAFLLAAALHPLAALTLFALLGPTSRQPGPRDVVP